MQLHIFPQNIVYCNPFLTIIFPRNGYNLYFKIISLIFSQNLCMVGENMEDLMIFLGNI